MAKIDFSKMTRAELEGYSRKYEAELHSIRRRADANPEGFKKDLGEREANYKAVLKHIRELDGEATATDPEGTSPTLADAEGNFADDARVAQIGGIGVTDSNTNPDDVIRRQRAVLKKAGVENVEAIPERELAGVNASQVDEDDDSSKGPKKRPTK